METLNVQKIFSLIAALGVAAAFIYLTPERTPVGQAVKTLSEPEIVTKQAEILSTDGLYLWVGMGGKLSEGVSGNVQSKLGGTLPPNTKINTYYSPKGDGFEIHTETDTHIIIKGFGPEAAERTRTVTIEDFNSAP